MSTREFPFAEIDKESLYERDPEAKRIHETSLRIHEKCNSPDNIQHALQETRRIQTLSPEALQERFTF